MHGDEAQPAQLTPAATLLRGGLTGGDHHCSQNCWNGRSRRWREIVDPWYRGVQLRQLHVPQKTRGCVLKGQTLLEAQTVQRLARPTQEKCWLPVQGRHST